MPIIARAGGLVAVGVALIIAYNMLKPSQHTFVYMTILFNVQLGAAMDSQILTAAITACFTIIVGVIVLVFGELAKRFFIEPIHEQSKLLSEIALSSTFYGNMFGNGKMIPEEEVKKASETLRKQASQLRASAWLIRWYWLWRLLGFVPKRKNVIDASTNLIALSNSMYNASPDMIIRNQKELESRLGFK